ncbi:MAG: acyl-CoA thioesterase [Calditrichaeota bacterium]|nr:MAG: acyl-CoA thioesterase [Calditrichota bacterium]
MFKLNDKVRLPDTDSAGILFFGNYFKLAHIIYEDFMESIGFSLQHIIDDSDILILIVHTEADYKKSLRLSEPYDLELSVEKIGSRSFTLQYRFLNKNNEICAEVQTVHAVINKETKKSISIPEELRKKLESHQ